MAIIKRRALPPQQERELEYYKARVEKQKAYIDYLAAMTDVEIPDEEEGADENEV